MIIEFELKDRSGTNAELGSVIEYTLPEIDLNNGNTGFYLPGGTITATIWWRASRGLMLRVIDGGDTDLKPGQYIPFRRTAHPWRVVETLQPNTASC